MEDVSLRKATQLAGLSIDQITLLHHQGLLPVTRTIGSEPYFLVKDINRLRAHRNPSISEEAAQVGVELQHDMHRSIVFLRGALVFALGILGSYVVAIVVLVFLFISLPVQTANWLGLTKTRTAIALNGSAQANKAMAAENAKPFVESNQVSSPSTFQALMQPPGKAALSLVRTVFPRSYATISEVTILDPNDILRLGVSGAVIPIRPLTIPESSLLQIDSNELITNLNAEYIQGKRPGNQPGDIAIVGEATPPPVNSPTTSGLTSTDLSAATIPNANLANSAITINTNGLLVGGGVVPLGGTVTLSMPNIGSSGTYGNATTIAVITTDAQGRVVSTTDTAISGLTVSSFSSDTLSQWVNDSGFITDSSVDTLTGKAISGSANALTAIDNVSLVNPGLNFIGDTGSGSVPLGGALKISGSGSNSVTYSSGTFTVAGAEVDTLGTVTGRGSTTASNLSTTGSGAITSAGLLTASNGLTLIAGALNLNSSSGALSLSGLTSSVISTVPTGSLSFTTGTTGTVTLDSGTTGGINIGNGANPKTITIGNHTGATAVNINSGTGNINFQAAGTGATGNLQVGAGGVGSPAPDLLVLDKKSTVGDPVGINGAMYYSASANKFRCFENSAWRDCETGPRTATLNDTTSEALSATEVELIDGTAPAIAPRTTANRIWITGLIRVNPTGGDNETSTFRVRRGSGVCTGTQVGTDLLVNTTAANIGDMVSINFIDSPATASTQAYTVCGLTSTATTPNTTPHIVVTLNEVSAAGADLAELYSTSDSSIEPGDVVSLDPSVEKGVLKTSGPSDHLALGIISTLPGLLLDDGVEGGRVVQLALAGRVPVKVTTENGVIQPGDYLTSSSTPGVAMRATKSGPVIGTALGVFDNKSSVGVVLAFIRNGSAVISSEPAPIQTKSSLLKKVVRAISKTFGGNRE